MKVLILLCLAPLCLSLSSCTLANKLIQAPVRLIQSGVRTVSDVDETSTPATADAVRSHGLALKTTTSAEPGR